MVKTIGVLTSGGDAPGMNAAVRAVARTCMNKGIECYGVMLGYKGLHEGNFYKFNKGSTRNIINIGGTILKSARFPEFKDIKVREEAIEQMKTVGMEALVVVGGDGSYHGALELTKMGINCIGLPGTIDNDIPDTDYTIGFDTCLNTIVEALDRLRDTSMSHQRCTILEVMGRTCGDLAVNAAIACGAEAVITRETGFDEEKLIELLKKSKASDKQHAIVVITEHVTDVNELAKRIEAATGFETRANVLGHLQRGGRPTARDRILASRMGIKAVELLENGYGGLCICEQGGLIVSEPIIDLFEHKRKVPDYLYADVDKLR